MSGRRLPARGISCGLKWAVSPSTIAGSDADVRSEIHGPSPARLTTGNTSSTAATELKNCVHRATKAPARTAIPTATAPRTTAAGKSKPSSTLLSSARSTWPYAKKTTVTAVMATAARCQSFSNNQAQTTPPVTTSIAIPIGTTASPRLKCKELLPRKCRIGTATAGHGYQGAERKRPAVVRGRPATGSAPDRTRGRRHAFGRRAKFRTVATIRRSLVAILGCARTASPTEATARARRMRLDRSPMAAARNPDPVHKWLKASGPLPTSGTPFNARLASRDWEAVSR